MTQVSPACARRIFASAAGLVTPSHGSTPRATRSSKLKSPGSVLSNQMATRPVYADFFALRFDPKHEDDLICEDRLRSSRSPGHLPRIGASAAKRYAPQPMSLVTPIALALGIKQFALLASTRG